MINIKKSSTYSLGQNVNLVIVITQHLHDQQLLLLIKEYLGCGNVNQNREAFDYRVTKLSDITEKIIPFFSKHRIRGVKALDFAD